MTELSEGRLVFRFGDACEVGKYDDWAFYRRRFQPIADSAAVDFVCVQGRDCWLIEVKDYSDHPRTKVIDLADEVARKVRDTLAGLAAARVNANEQNERRLAQRAFRSSCRWRVVLHLELPAHPSRLRPQPIDPASVLQKLRQTARAIDPHPKVADMHRPIGPWTVQ